MEHPHTHPLQRGVLLRHSGGCLSPRVLDFLCFDTPRSVLGSPREEDELTFYLVEQGSLDELVRLGTLPCPALWVEHAALAAGGGQLQVVYRLGGAAQHCPLPFKPLKLQPSKQGAGGGTGSARSGAGSARGSSAGPACRAFVSSRAHMHLYRLTASLFPRLEQLDRDLCSGAVALRAAEATGWAAPGLQAGTATVLPQGVLLERLDEEGRPLQLSVALDFEHAALVLRDPPGLGATPDCLRSVNSLAEALAALNGEAGRLGPSLTASPAKPGGRAAATLLASPAKPPLPAAHGADGLRLGVGLVQRCTPSALREGLAILLATAGSPQLSSEAVGLGALEALVAAAATVLPSPSMGLAELLPSLTVAVTSLLDAAPPPACAAARLVTILAAVLRRGCASPLLLCRLLTALLERPDVRAEAMGQGLAGPIAAMYTRVSPAAAAAAVALEAEPAWADGANPNSHGRERGQPLQRRASPLHGAARLDAAGSRGRLSLVLDDAASDCCSDCSPPVSRSASPVKALSLQSPSAASGGRFSVPRLALPAADSPPCASAGLTRSTRRTMGSTPGGARSPSPFASPTRRGSAGEPAEASAGGELALLAAALGESLVAADLPSIVAHKRAADARLADAAEHGVPPELPEPAGAAPPAAARKVLEAHRILVTARSLRSADSSASCASAATDARGGPAAGGPREAADADQVKGLLLKALAAALPLLEGPGWPAQDPSPVVAAEVLALLGRPLTAGQEQLKGLAVAALLRLSQRPRGAGQPADGASPSAQASVAAGGRHALVVAAGRRLDVLCGGGAQEAGARGELLALLTLLADYTAAAQEGGVAAALVRHCQRGLQAVMGLLQAAGLDPGAWPQPAWQLLQAAAVLLAAACRKCEDAAAGRGLLALLLADQQVAAMLAAAAAHVLLPGEQPAAAAAAGLAQRARAAALRRDLLHLFAALMALAGRQPPCVQPTQQGRGAFTAASRLPDAAPPGHDPGHDLLLGPSARRGLTRRSALLFFSFLVSPHSGLAQRILDQAPAAGEPGDGGAQPRPSGGGPDLPGVPAAANVRLRQGLLELLKAAFTAPGSPYAADKFVTDFYIRFHFLQLLKLYHNPHRDHQALFLCRQHMSLLLALASAPGAHIRHRFHQLSVVDFFVRELSLEFEAKQPARGRMHRLSSGGSQLDRRRTSSCSGGGGGGLESGHASPVPSLRLSLPPLREPDHHAAALPAGVPLLRLPSRSHGGGASDGDSGASSPALQLPPGIAAGAAERGPAVPRLNLGFGPTLGSGSSPGGHSTPSPGNSARHGRPPLPPSARSGIGATPRLTSRLGRTVSARSGDMTAAAAAAAAAAAGAAHLPALQQPQQQAAPLRSSSSGGLGTSKGKLGIPKLGLAGVGRSLSQPAAEPPPLSARASPSPALEGRTASRVHFGRLPSDAEGDSDAESSVDGGRTARGGGGGDGGGGDGGGGDAAPMSPATLLGVAVPEGFCFSGDLEEDLERLEALEGGGTLSEGGDSEQYEGPESEGETASPTIPALRASPFQRSPGPVPPLLAPPRAKAPLPPPDGGGAGGFGGSAGGVPRLQIGSAMRSTLEQRNASAELQMAADAEQQGSGRPGRGVLGELERGALGKGKVQAAAQRRLRSALSDVAGSSAADVPYSEERCRRLLYRDEGLHLEVLQLVFALVFGPEGRLDPLYCDQFPWERKLQNIPFILYHHLNHEDNRPLLPHLLPRLAATGSSRGASAAAAAAAAGPPPALRLLRLLCAAFFRPEWYTGRSRISSAAGAYSTVYRAVLPAWAGDGTVVLKLVDTPKHIQDRCAQVDVQSEVSILEGLAGCPAACQLLDFGVDPAAEAMFLVLKDYRCSLKQWRARQPAQPAGQLRLYYALFGEVAAAAAALLDRGVVHFDLKCDNCLLEPLPGVSEAEFWHPSSERLPFRVVLADFGESKAFGGDSPDAAFTSRARGTDCFKSPEMLLAGGGAHHREQRAFDRRRRRGAGPPSDVWSLACLLFELVTGKLLFSDSDWLQLVARVTSSGMPLITEERTALVAGLPGMLELLHFMLVRDARMRPSLADVQARLAAVRGSSRAPLPPHVRVSAPPLSSRGSSHLGLARSEGSQVFSPTCYAPSPKAAQPMPLLAALPLSPQLVLAPLALLGGAAPLRQHPARRVVLLFSSSSGAGLGGCRGMAAGLSPASSPGSRSGASSRSGSPPPGRRRTYGSAPARTLTFSANPVFSPGSGLDSLPAGAGTPAPPPAGPPNRLLRCASTPARGGSISGVTQLSRAATAASAASSLASSPGCSPSRPLLAAARVCPEASPLRFPTPGQQVGAGLPELRGLQLILAPPPAAAAVAGGTAGPAASDAGSPRSGGDGGGDAMGDSLLLAAVLDDAELAAAASSCAAAGVECRVARVGPFGVAARLQQPLALAEWLSATALPLLGGASDCTASEGEAPVLLAVQAGCEPEAAMAVVAHEMLRRRRACGGGGGGGGGLHPAMVAASQWGLDLFLRQQHLLALQHWAASEGQASGGGS